MIDDIESLAAEAVTEPVEPRQKPTIDELLKKAAQQPIHRRPIERCPGCNGAGFQYTRFSFLWGHVCWACGGWGGVDFKRLRFAPIQGHPYRVGLNGR